MLLSLPWLNDYLEPGNVSRDEAERVFMNLGSPVEVWEGDRFDLEVTSNRGDLLCHLGAARELAAKTGRKLVLSPEVLSPGCSAQDPGPRTQDSSSAHIKVVNQEPDLCPLFTARVIRSVKVGPSPAWLRSRLESVGQRSINNVVDVTNFINFELGNPCHAFDLAKLAGGSLIIRKARPKEELTTLDGKKRVLHGDELVVADTQRAQSLAGVIGGATSEVSAETKDVVLEVATWNPGTVRKAARRHGVRTDASYRFERTVDPRTLQHALDRGAALIALVSSGRLCEGTVSDGRPLEEPTRIRFRPRRSNALMGIDVSTDEMVSILQREGIDVNPLGRGGEELTCTIPPNRPDLTREVDLIEEVARFKGLDALPIHDKVAVAVKPEQPFEVARRDLAAVLTGQGFFEAVTFSFTTPKEGAMFLPRGLALLQVDESRQAGEPTLRPSILTGLLACRRKNQHAHVHVPGGVRLFEVGSIYAESKDTGRKPGATTLEFTNLSLILDIPTKGKQPTIPELQHGIRMLRGVIETLAKAMAGSVPLLVEPATPHTQAFEGSPFAFIKLAGQVIGYIGVLSPAAQAHYDLAAPIAAAEVNLAGLLAHYPPKGRVTELPAFPGIERDVSLVVADSVPWSKIEQTVQSRRRPPLESVAFVGTFRGQQLGKGKKSVTLRLAFRDPSRTLRNEEVDAPTATIIDSLRAEVGAELRV